MDEWERLDAEATAGPREAREPADDPPRRDVSDGVMKAREWAARTAYLLRVEGVLGEAPERLSAALDALILAARRDERERCAASASLAARIAALEADERAIVELILARIEMGRRQYGPWRVDDGRDYPREVLHEALDAMAYLAAEMLRMTRR